MDALIGLTEILQKLDANLEGTIRKVEKQRRELGPDWRIEINLSEGKSKSIYIAHI